MYRHDPMALLTVILLAACTAPPSAPPPPGPPSPPDPVVGQGDCLNNETWRFGDPADTANHAAFLAHATAQTYVGVPSTPGQQGGVLKNLPVVLPAPGGGHQPPIQDAVRGEINPRAGINGSRRASYEPTTEPCPGRVIGRVHIDGTQSRIPSIAAEADRALRERQNAQGRVLPDALALLGGYKTMVHRHGSLDPDPGLEHSHRYFPEGTSYIWMDSLTTVGTGETFARGVIVSSDTSVAPWVVRIRYCPHEDPSNPHSDPHCDPAHPVPSSRPLARWIDIPEDDHAWEWCAMTGCCLVESSTFR